MVDATQHNSLRGETVPRSAGTLIAVLVDPTARPRARQDAAVALARLDEAGVETALATVACDTHVDDDLARSCGDALAKLWVRRGRVTLSIFARLVPGASQAVLARLRDKAPDLALQAESIENMLGVRPPYNRSSGVWGDSKFA